MMAATLAAADAAVPPAEQLLNSLRKPHPRIMATEADFQRLRELCRSEPQAGAWLGRLRDAAVELLSEPPVRYEIPDGKRLLSVSRRTKDRLQLLGLMSQLTGERRFADRAWIELETVCDFKDWNPSHFLDTAEMTNAVAIGYDWMSGEWTDAQRATMRQAMIDKGLKQALSIYRGQSGWSKANHNWNQVCNGGIGIGALAIADEEPELAQEILAAALRSLPVAMHEFRPDGGWGEGPGYWRYATEYNVYFLAALRTALGTDFGLSQSPGFPVTGDFPAHFVGPTGETFNYADAKPGWSGAPQLFWLASTFQQPVYAATQRPMAEEQLSPLDLLWGAAWLSQNPTPAGQPLDRQFQGVQVATMRGAWGNPQTTFVGVKGGDNRVNHGHLDLGTFVLDALGERWITDLGPDDYNLPGFFGKGRWGYYRCRAEGHNTLVMNPGADPDQDPEATAELILFRSEPARAATVVDLTRAYRDHVDGIRRGVALLERRDVLIQDEVLCRQPVDLWWFAHTPAAMRLSTDGRTTTLTQRGKTLYVRLLSPAEARFEELPAAPLPTSPDPKGQADNQAGDHPVRKLGIHLTAEGVTRISVLFATREAGDVDLRPLGEW
jgi:hypothetical protein